MINCSTLTWASDRFSFLFAQGLGLREEEGLTTDKKILKIDPLSFRVRLHFFFIFNVQISLKMFAHGMGGSNVSFPWVSKF